jgi:cyclophilin family peptidyl-prolyl cis-trans isomerase
MVIKVRDLKHAGDGRGREYGCFPAESQQQKRDFSAPSARNQSFQRTREFGSSFFLSVQITTCLDSGFLIFCRESSNLDRLPA